jgi:hypothetical protein
MPRLTAIAHGGAEIGRPNENAIHPIDRGNLGRGCEPWKTFDLDEQANLVVGAGKIVGDRAPSRCAHQAARDTADTRRRIACRAHQRFSLRCALDIGNEQSLHAHIEIAFDKRRVLVRNACDWVRSIRRDRLQLGQ